MTKINQQQFLQLVGSFNILGSLNLRELSETDPERKQKLTDRKAEELQRFKALWLALEPEQRTAIDNLVEFGLTGTEYTTYSELVDALDN